MAMLALRGPLLPPMRRKVPLELLDSARQRFSLLSLVIKGRSLPLCQGNLLPDGHEVDFPAIVAIPLFFLFPLPFLFRNHEAARPSSPEERPSVSTFSLNFFRSFLELSSAPRRSRFFLSPSFFARGRQWPAWNYCFLPPHDRYGRVEEMSLTPLFAR